MGERRAYICTHKQCVPPRRVFIGEDDPVPECQEHGKTMKRQANMPYMQGKKTGQPKRVAPRRPTNKGEKKS